MRLGGRRQSTNVQDRRGMRAGPIAAGGGIGAVVIALVVMLLGGDPGAVLQTGPVGGTAPPAVEAGPPDDEAGQFVSIILASTEDTWDALFSQQFNQDYPEPDLVLFSDATSSGCGFAQAAVGPFYCPLDQQVYLDLSFFRDLGSRFGAPGDFAQAYVIAHEVGHHVQTVLGISDEVRAAQQRAGREEANALSVRMELQADCFAGVWGYHAREMQGIVEPGEVQEALNAASAIGDDRLQRQSQGYVVPESFTHGSSAQRVRWFRRGFESGDVRQCDTFNAREI